MDSEDVVVFGTCAAIVAALIGLGMWGDSTGCHHRWSRSGFEVSWGPIQGCLISHDGSTFVPEDNYRQTESP